MRTTTKIKLAWKYRRVLWKLRGLYQRRKDIAALALTGTIVTIAALRE